MWTIFSLYWNCHTIASGFLFICGFAGSSLLHGLFSSCGDQGLFFIEVCGLLTVGASLAAEHWFKGMKASGVAACGFCSWGTRA